MVSLIKDCETESLFFGGSNLCRATEHFNDFLFFDQESAYDAFANASMAENSTVGTGYCLLTFWDAGTFQWTCWPDSLQLFFTLTAFWDVLTLLDVLVNQSATWRTNTANKQWTSINWNVLKQFDESLKSIFDGNCALKMTSWLHKRLWVVFLHNMLDKGTQNSLIFYTECLFSKLSMFL